MSKRKLEVRFSWEHRVNDHSIQCHTLYCNEKKVYSARYLSCVVDYVNENYAKVTNTRLKKKMERLNDKAFKFGSQADEIRRTLNKPLVKVIGMEKK